MCDLIVESATGITIVGSGETTLDTLQTALYKAPTLVAADGGAARALNLGYTATAVIGDLDSIDIRTRTLLPPHIFHPIFEQETTDFDKTLRSVSSTLLIAVGFTGGRLDHELAVFSTLVKRADAPCIVLGAQDLIFVAPLQLKIKLPVGTRFSLFPMGPVRGTSEGLRWPIDGLDFAPDGRVGTSNEVTADEVALRLTARNMLVILPAQCLDAAITAIAPDYIPPVRT